MPNEPQKPKLSVRRQAQGALERIAEMEEALPQLLASFNQAVGTLQNQVSHMTEIVDAVVSCLGEDQVVTAIETLRVNKAVRLADARKAKVVQALEAGLLVAEEVVRPYVKHADFDKMNPRDPARIQDPGSYVATTEFNAKGEPLPGAYQCQLHANVNEEFQAAMVGKKAGDEVPAPLKDKNGNPALGPDGKQEIGKIVIMGVYKSVPKPAPEKAAAPALKAVPDAPQEAPGADATATSEAVTPAPAGA